ncbi:MAG TPA: hypothetical protein VFF79_18530 [Conexibacter sp.]|nr:hypothetical protein [Conexibacter sp.]
MHRLRRPSALLVSALVMLAASAGLSALRHPTGARLSHDAALRAVLDTPRDARVLAHGERWTSVRVTPVDRAVTRVSFFAGPRLLAEAAVTPRGRIERFADYRGLAVPYGAPLSQRPWLIALGCVAFLLATAVVPLRRLRNLDVLALLAFVVPLALLDAGLVVASTLTAVPPLLWLAGRCAWRALAPESGGWGAPAVAGERPAGDVTAPASRPLLDALTPAWDDEQRMRVLRVAVVAAASAVTMITLSAPSTVDVGQAVMEGGTLLLHGTLPYGHLPGDVFHGDTYPLLSYLAYAPLAALMPVRDNWDVANGALVVAAGAALLVGWLLARGAAAWAHTGGPVAGERSDPAARAAGLRAALAWLACPPLVVAVSSGTSDVLLAALLAAALVLARRRVASAALVLAAGWLKLVPFALLPIWLARLRGRRLAAALALLAASAAGTWALLVALGGAGAPARMLHAIAFQLDRRTLHSPWSLLGIERLQPLAQAAVLGLVAGATVRTWRDPAFGRDAVRLAALAGAVLLGIQLCGNYWTYLYLAWAVPPIVLSLLAEVPAPAPVRAATPARARAAALV